LYPYDKIIFADDYYTNAEHYAEDIELISRDLRECSGIVSMLDAKMLSLNEAILKAKREQEEQP